ncbi:hypothetical protein [Flavobacterium degerlachei]|uniref:Uncharacterized protein n=1 Tax=Flavobacterium degerlachei TaxID=229203 RepID=A0A1H3E9D1_9FLAO|nr:hypothetical protein [Flavobacterium degerlachei]SDX75200.1 hypothetical protein SAMN05444338_11479 [Flavobacterium degerlachei]
MSFSENILGFITDSNKRLSTRATVIVLFIFSILLIDNITGFSHYYNKERQLEQLKSISVLLKDTTLAKLTRLELISLQKETFNRKNLVDHSLSFIKYMRSTNNESNSNVTNTAKMPPRNDVWFLLSTSGIYILVTLLLIPILLLTDKTTPFLKLIATLIIFGIVMFFTSWFNYWLFDKIIPDMLFGSWIWNYIINFMIQIALIAGLYWTTSTINKTH